MALPDWVDAAGEAAEASNLNDLETRIKAAVPAFSQHSWTQKTSSTPLSAANLNARVREDAPLNVEWDEYGADPLGTAANNQAAIQAAIDALPNTPSSPRGGKILLPDFYDVNDGTSGPQLDLSDHHNVTFIGLSGNQANEPATTGAARSGINYTGTTASSLFNCQSTQGCLWDGLTVTHDAAWTGLGFDFQHSATGGDSQHNVIRNSSLAGFLQNTCTWVSYRNAIFQQMENVYIGRCAYGIRGRENVGASIAFSNAIHLERIQFARCNEAIVNPGDQWTVVSPWVEGTGGNIQHFVLNDLTTTNIVGNLCIVGGWLGDSFSAVPDYWMDFNFGGANLCTVRNLSMLNVMFNQEKVLRLKGGDRSIVILGGQMGQSTTDTIDLGSTAGRGYTILGADFSGAGTSGVDAIANRDPHFQKVILGNTWGANNGTRGYDEITMVGASHIHKADADATPTTSSIHANAGSGATVAYTGSDLGGRITLTTGTGAGAGVSNLVVINFNKTFQNSIPHVVLTPANQAAAALGGWYASVPSVSQFNLALDTGKTLASTTAYQFHYQVV